MNPTRLGLRRRTPDKAKIRSTIDNQKTNILALPDDAQRKDELERWQSELEDTVYSHTRQAVTRMQTPVGLINIYFKAFLAVLMAAMSVYFLVATLNLPSFPGWEVINGLSFNIWRIKFDTLGYVGLSFGWTALTLSRLIIIILQPDRDKETKLYIQDLREATGGRRSLLYRIRWCGEVWLGGTPWKAIIAVALDLALGYVLAEGFVSWIYHHGSVAGVTHNALIAITQMPFGGLLWFIRSVALYGLTSPEEKALGWIEGQLEQIEEQDASAWVEEWKRLRMKRKLMLGGPLCGYLAIVVLFYSGFLAKSNLTWFEGLVVSVMLGICGIFAGMFFAGMTSRTLGKLQGADTPKQKVIRAQKDFRQAFFSIPVTAQSLFGSLVVQLFGHGYSHTNAAVLGGSYQQGYQDVVGLLFNYIESGEEGKRRVVAFLGRLSRPVAKRRKAGRSDDDKEGSSGPQIVQATVSPSEVVAELVSDICARVQDLGQQWTAAMEQAGQSKDELARSILEQHERLTGTSLDALYRDSEQLASMQTEATRQQGQLTDTMREKLNNAAVAEMALRAVKQLLGNTSTEEQTGA